MLVVQLGWVVGSGVAASVDLVAARGFADVSAGSASEEPYSAALLGPPVVALQE